MATDSNRLIDILIQRFSLAGFHVPNMTEAARELFVLHALENSVIVQTAKLDNLLDAAHQIVHQWERVDPDSAMRKLNRAVWEVTNPSTPPLLIICQGGLVQDVVGSPEEQYEICNCDAFDGPEDEAERYFDSLSDLAKKYLRMTAWNTQLPKSRRTTHSAQ